MVVLLSILLAAAIGVASYFARQLKKAKAKCEAAEIKIKDTCEAQYKLYANKSRLAEIIEEHKNIAQGIIDEYERAWRERDFSSFRIYQLEKIQKELKKLMKELED